MRTNKAILVTAIIAVLLIAIIVGLFFLAPVAAFIITGLFLLYGFIRSFYDFYKWLVKDDNNIISKGDF